MYLYQNFLEDDEEYAKSEKLWAHTLSGIVKHLGQRQRWKIPWVKPRYGDGTPHQDGNPMFTALDRSRRLAVIVIQVPPVANSETDLTHWTKTLAKGDPEQAEALVIACVLSDDTLAQATDLMTKWALQEPLDDCVREARVRRTPRAPMPRRHGTRRA